MSYARYRQKVALKIKKARQKVGITQEDMEGFGFNTRHYQDIEAGRVNVTLETIYRLAQAFKVSPVKLVSQK